MGHLLLSTGHESNFKFEFVTDYEQYLYWLQVSSDIEQQYDYVIYPVNELSDCYE